MSHSWWRLKVQNIDPQLPNWGSLHVTWVFLTHLQTCPAVR